MKWSFICSFLQLKFCLSVYCTCMIRNSKVIDIFGDDLLGSWQKLRDSNETISFLLIWQFLCHERPVSHPENQKAFKKNFGRLVVFCHTVDWKVKLVIKLTGYHLVTVKILYVVRIFNHSLV